MSIRALLLIAALACAACHQAEVQPASEWPTADPALLGAVNLEAGCIADFDPEIDYFPHKTEFRRSAQLEVRYQSIFGDVSRIIDAARASAARSVNSFMTAAYWMIGRHIVEFEQKGRERAGYGEGVVEQPSAYLTARYGRGFTLRNV